MTQMNGIVLEPTSKHYELYIQETEIKKKNSILHRFDQCETLGYIIVDSFNLY